MTPTWINNYRDYMFMTMDTVQEFAEMVLIAGPSAKWQAGHDIQQLDYSMTVGDYFTSSDSHALWQGMGLFAVHIEDDAAQVFFKMKYSDNLLPLRSQEIIDAIRDDRELQKARASSNQLNLNLQNANTMGQMLRLNQATQTLSLQNNATNVSPTLWQQMMGLKR